MEKSIPYLRAVGMTFLLIGFVTGLLFPSLSIHTYLMIAGGLCFITTFGYSIVSVVQWYLHSGRREE